MKRIEVGDVTILEPEGPEDIQTIEEMGDEVDFGPEHRREPPKKRRRRRRGRRKK